MCASCQNCMGKLGYLVIACSLNSSLLRSTLLEFNCVTLSFKETKSCSNITKKGICLVFEKCTNKDIPFAFEFFYVWIFCLWYICTQVKIYMYFVIVVSECIHSWQAENFASWEGLIEGCSIPPPSLYHPGMPWWGGGALWPSSQLKIKS